MEKKYSLDDFIGIMRKLISEDGCPWDKVQTHESLRRYLIEESYEAIDAINNNDKENLCEELGDVLLQVVFHSLIAEKNSDFSFDDVINGVSEKMIRRHPHIFANENAETAQEVLKNWDEIKKVEKNYSSVTDTLKSVPKSFPALMRAEKVQNKAAKVGFDFEEVSQTIDKLEEEIAELKAELNKTTVKECKIMEEYGDLLFAATNISRFLKINPEFALTNATEKFINRFEYIENALNSKGKEISLASAEEMNALWNESKGIEEK